MTALNERKLQIVRSLVETAPDQVVGSLKRALAETSGDSALDGVRKLVEVAERDRILRDLVMQPVVAMFVAGSGNVRALTFPSAALALIWNALREDQPDTVRDVRTAVEDSADPHILTTVYDQLLASAVIGLRTRSTKSYQAAAEACDAARPDGAAVLVSCLAIAAVVRKAIQKLPEWVAHPGGADTAAAARLAYKDAVKIDEDAGCRFFEMLAAQLAQPWMVLRIISAVMEKPTERYLADSELAGFGEAVLDDIDASLAAIARLDLESGETGGRAAARRAQLVVDQIVEVESSVQLQRNHGWGQRVHKQRISLAGVIEGLLREAGKSVIKALPMHMPRQRHARRLVPRLGVPPDIHLVGRVRTLLSFSSELRKTASQGGFSSARARLVETLSEFLGHYVEEVLELLRHDEAEDRDGAAAFLAIAAEFSQLVSGEKAGELVRRRTQAALLRESPREAWGQ